MVNVQNSPVDTSTHRFASKDKQRQCETVCHGSNRGHS